jgi:hypothetical protein
LAAPKELAVSLNGFSAWPIYSYGRGAGVGWTRGAGVRLGGVAVAVAVGIAVAVGVGVIVGVGPGKPAQYLPPVFKRAKLKVSPPQTIISLPVHTAV